MTIKSLIVGALFLSTSSLAWGMDREACLAMQKQGKRISCPQNMSEKEHGGSRGDVDDEAGKRRPMDDSSDEATADEPKED